MIDPGETAWGADFTYDRIRVMLAGRGPEFQGMVVSQLMAMYAAGHHPAVRAGIVTALNETAKKLIPFAEREIGVQWDQVEVPEPERVEVVGIIGDIMQALADCGLAMTDSDGTLGVARVKLDAARTLLDGIGRELDAREGLQA